MTTDDATQRLEALAEEARRCTLCAAALPLPPRPVFRAHTSASILIVGQAPGRRVHETGIPWNDPSGDRLRDWLQVDREAFYDQRRFAIIPTGLCYPGKGTRGDLPPRPECAPLWHPKFRALLHRIQLTLLIGTHAQAFYLGNRRKASLGETVRCFTDYLPQFFPLPHPSQRNIGWFQANPWFERDIVPQLRKSLASAS